MRISCFFILGVTSVAGITSGQAAASCPVQGDVERGIYIVYSGNSYIRYQAAPDGTYVIEDETYVGEDAGRLRLTVRHGYLATSMTDFVNGVLDGSTRSKSSFAAGVESYPPLKENMSIKDSITETDADGSETFDFTLTSETERPFVIGTCSYRGIPFKARHDTDEWSEVHGVYLKELGISAYTAYPWEGGDDADARVLPLTISVHTPEKGLLLK